ncbi:MAG: hypothetical protein ABIX00_10110 [Polaromonas sp.]
MTRQDAGLIAATGAPWTSQRTAWLLFWLAGSGALLQRHLKRQGLLLPGMSASAAAPATSVKARDTLALQFVPGRFSLMGTP